MGTQWVLNGYSMVTRSISTAACANILLAERIPMCPGRHWFVIQVLPKMEAKAGLDTP